MRCCSYPAPLNSIIKLKGVRVERHTVILTLHKWDYVFVHGSRMRARDRGAFLFTAKPAAGTTESGRLLCDYDDLV